MGLQVDDQQWFFLPNSILYFLASSQHCCNKQKIETNQNLNSVNGETYRTSWASFKLNYTSHNQNININFIHINHTPASINFFWGLKDLNWFSSILFVIELSSFKHIWFTAIITILSNLNLDCKELSIYSTYGCKWQIQQLL